MTRHKGKGLPAGLGAVAAIEPGNMDQPHLGNLAAVAGLLMQLLDRNHEICVATAAGIVFALAWPLGLLLTIVWLTMAFGFKISSLAGLTTAALLPLGMFYLRPGTYAWVSVAIALLLFWRHRANIRQLLSGRETTIGR